MFFDLGGRAGSMEASDVSVLVGGQLVRLIDCFRPKNGAPVFGLTAHAGVTRKGDADGSGPSNNAGGLVSDSGARHVLVPSAAVGATLLAGHRLVLKNKAAGPATEERVGGVVGVEAVQDGPQAIPPFFVPSDVNTASSATILRIGCFANDLAIGDKETGTLEAYEATSAVRNVAVLQWRLDAVELPPVGGARGNVLLTPSFPVIAMGAFNMITGLLQALISLPQLPSLLDLYIHSENHNLRQRGGNGNRVSLRPLFLAERGYF